MKGKSKGQSKTPSKSKVKLWNSGKPKHIKKDCKRNKNISNASTNKSLDDGNDALIIWSNFVSDDSWLIDLGFSYHMTLNKDWFTKYIA
jgi:hypothetical protein